MVYSPFMTGSVRRGDIYFEDDQEGSPTYIDFSEDTITMRPSGSAILHLEDDAVGVNTTDPRSTLSIAGSVAANITQINKDNNNSSTYTVQDTDFAIFVNTRPTAQNGINSSLSITLPLAAEYPGRILIVKDAGGYSDTNVITIQRTGGDVIDGTQTSINLASDNGDKKLMSNGGTMWFTI